MITIKQLFCHHSPHHVPSVFSMIGNGTYYYFGKPHQMEDRNRIEPQVKNSFFDRVLNFIGFVLLPGAGCGLFFYPRSLLLVVVPEVFSLKPCPASTCNAC